MTGVPHNNTTRAARLMWWLLPRIGYYAEGFDRVRAWPFYMAWKLVGSLPSSALFKPYPPVECDCDYCLGLTDVWTP